LLLLLATTGNLSHYDPRLLIGPLLNSWPDDGVCAYRWHKTKVCLCLEQTPLGSQEISRSRVPIDAVVEQTKYIAAAVNTRRIYNL